MWYIFVVTICPHFPELEGFFKTWDFQHQHGDWPVTPLWEADFRRWKSSGRMRQWFCKCGPQTSILIVIPGLHPRPIESETLRWGSEICLNKAQGWFWYINVGESLELDLSLGQKLGKEKKLTGTVAASFGRTFESHEKYWCKNTDAQAP